MSFRVGDVVVLKSGGAAMTVEEETDEQLKVKCCWQNPNGSGGFDTVRSFFVEETLELVSTVKARQKAEHDRIEREIDAAQREY